MMACRLASLSGMERVPAAKDNLVCFIGLPALVLAEDVDAFERERFCAAFVLFAALEVEVMGTDLTMT